jgi:hypothetical protein
MVKLAGLLGIVAQSRLSYRKWKIKEKRVNKLLILKNVKYSQCSTGHRNCIPLLLPRNREVNGG